MRAPGLEVVSFLYEGPRFDPAEHDRIRVIAPAVGELVSEPVRVRAVALPLKTYYRMDAVLPEEGPLIWPLKDVLAPAGLVAEQIGVFGWSGSEIDKVFVPVRLLAADDVAGAGSEQGGEQAPSAELLVRLANDAEKVLWRYKEEPEDVRLDGRGRRRRCRRPHCRPVAAAWTGNAAADRCDRQTTRR